MLVLLNRNILIIILAVYIISNNLRQVDLILYNKASVNVKPDNVFTTRCVLYRLKTVSIDASCMKDTYVLPMNILG